VLDVVLVAMDSPSHDTLFGGAVALAQPSRESGAYRVNVDAILLAAFAAGRLGEHSRPRRARTAFDLGAGVGAVGLSLLHMNAVEHVTMVEVDAVLAALASTNARTNAWQERVRVECIDVAKAVGTADLVVVNPPYVPPGRGRAPLANRERARSGSLDLFLDAARRVAGRRARVCFVYPAIETTTLLVSLRKRGLEPKRMQAVYGKRTQARVVLVEAMAAKPGGLVMEAPYFDRPGGPDVLPLSTR
jgi:tRNA1Val (adenine37-N6)-methyltransferase